MPQLFLVPFIFIIGLEIGSFLNVLIDRFPKNEGVVRGRSYCDHCRRKLGFFDLIPLLSFLLLRGKCRYCKAKISFYYPIVELVTGLLFVLATFNILNNFQFSIFNFQSTLPLLYYLFITSALVVVFFTDLKYGIIPDKIAYPAILVSFLFFILNSEFLISHLLSAIGASLFFYVLILGSRLLLRKEGMGAGDVKFAFLIGFLLGFPLVIVSLYLAFLTGAAVSLILILWGKKTRHDTIPFGTFLALSTYVSLFWGKEILQLAEKILFG